MNPLKNCGRSYVEDWIFDELLCCMRDIEKLNFEENNKFYPEI